MCSYVCGRCVGVRVCVCVGVWVCVCLCGFVGVFMCLCVCVSARVSVFAHSMRLCTYSHVCVLSRRLACDAAVSVYTLTQIFSSKDHDSGCGD